MILFLVIWACLLVGYFTIILAIIFEKEDLAIGVAVVSVLLTLLIFPISMELVRQEGAIEATSRALAGEPMYELTEQPNGEVTWELVEGE